MEPLTKPTSLFVKVMAREKGSEDDEYDRLVVPLYLGGLILKIR
jgi:hypothetical protein